MDFRISILIDGHYVKPHRFKKGTLQRNQTFSISVVDAIIQRIANPQLGSSVENGVYQFVDSQFVLNHPLIEYFGLSYDPSKIIEREQYWKLCLNTIKSGYNDN